MKKILIILCLVAFSPSIFSQEESNAEMYASPETPIYKVSLGLDAGLNYLGIVALTGEINVAKNFCLNAGAGVGSWGSKLTIGGRFYTSYPKGVYYGASYSHSSGGEGLEIDLQTTTSGDNTQKIEMNLKPMNNLNLGIGYQWKIGNRFRFHFDLGYSVPFETEPWEVVTTGVELSKTSKQLLNIMAPGGIMLGLGFSVGLY